MPLNIFTWLLAFSPVLMVLILMLRFKWGGSKAGAFSWFVALGVAIIFFGAGPRLIAYTQAKAVLLSLDVMYIIWTALLLFHTASEAGAIQDIGQALTRLTASRTLQGLLVGWLFVSFLQGMGGFGVPVAVTAPLLVGLGFNPIQAVLIACIGHGWAVNFGSLATSFQTMIAVTGLPGELLAHDSALLLGISCFFCGGIVALIAGGWRGFVRTLPAVLVLGGLMGSAQYWLATHRLWTLGATGGAMVGLAGGILLSRLPFVQQAAARAAAEQGEPGGVRPVIGSPGNGSPSQPRSLLLSMSAYGILVVLAFSTNLIPPVRAFLDQVIINMQFPELSTSLGWVTPAEGGRSISLFGHPGAILFYSSALSFLIYRRSGYYQPGALRRILDKTAHGAISSSLAILSMVGMAVIMSHAGMTNILALGLSQSVGRAAYPVVATLIGALGAFITGSNNNSNVLFAILQMETAGMLGLHVPLILGAQTAGASLGSVMAPAKVIVGCSTVGLGGKEGAVMLRVMKWGVIPLALVALAATILVR